MDVKPAILFLGTSLVAGTLGFPLAPELSKHFTVHNYGINGVQLPGLIDQLNTVAIPSSIRPDYIVVIAGGNDLTASLDYCKSMPKIIQERRGRPDTNLTRFSEELKEYISLLKKKYPSAPILIGDIKPIGEDIQGSLNRLVTEYNQEISKIAKDLQVHLIPTFDPLAEELSKLSQEEIAKLVGSDEIDKIFSPSRMITVFLLQKATLGWYSYNDMGEARGFYLTCDGSHWNERSGNVVIQSILKAIKTFTDSKLNNQT
jgi:lysophospholipase L1-like esterase